MPTKVRRLPHRLGHGHPRISLTSRRHERPWWAPPRGQLVPAVFAILGEITDLDDADLRISCSRKQCKGWSGLGSVRAELVDDDGELAVDRYGHILPGQRLTYSPTVRNPSA
ncbi:hypothetical protein [Frankia torreyi]|uniref:hypothetical protein n=1 Tax=Frankia torreyi TaxID=1856 RepID=UPI001A7E3AFE|nr:hypothetical protein [Frankia torreyi]